MSCDEHAMLLDAYVDGELPAEQRRRLEDHLRRCARCRRELAALTALKEDLAMIEFKEPEDAELDRYWRGLYNRLERGVGWVLLSVGAIVLGCYGGFRLVEALVRSPEVSIVLKIGLVAVVFGIVVLFVSILRERLAVRKVDKYSREVKR